jgi:hypothetical protein
MIYDACVLAPKSGEELYLRYDVHKLKARVLIGRNGTSEKKVSQNNYDNDASSMMDPEYELLSNVLKWFNGETSDSDPTVMDFIKQTFFNVIQNLESTEILKKSSILKPDGLIKIDSGIYLVELWKDAIVQPKKPVSFHDINSIPLKLLLMDAYNGNSLPKSEESKKAATWIAAASEYQLSFQSLKTEAGFRLETTASGHEKSDFIFIFADKSINTENILPPGFHVEKTDSGQLAWNLDVSAKTIEDSLITIGRNLLRESPNWDGQ